jgi:hypothetical protein
MQYRPVLIYYADKVRLMEGVYWRSGQSLVPKKCDINVGPVKRGLIEGAKEGKVAWVEVIVLGFLFEGGYGRVIVKVHWKFEKGKLLDQGIKFQQLNIEALSYEYFIRIIF